MIGTRLPRLMLVAIAAGLWIAGIANAAAPLVKTQAPGFYRMMLGDFEVTDKNDSDYWLSKANLDAAPKDMKSFFQGAQASLNPYVAAGKFNAFEGATELIPGVKAMASHGHAPRHTTYLVESKGQKLVLWGDLMHVSAVQFPDPSVTMAFDVDPKAAAEQRRNAYDDAAKQGYWVSAAHIPFPGVGHLRAEGSGYVWIPANYVSLR